jgi:hypothetical protein
MRVSPPDSLRIDRTALLDEVRERLSERAPELVEALDPTHPAWIVLQESAWMVETLTEQLDRYPWGVLRQLAHLLGAELRPARPAVGVVTLAVQQAGRLDLGTNPSRWRLFTPQTEERGLVEFAIAEDGVPVVPGSVVGLARLRQGELWRAGTGDGTLPTADGFAWWRPGPRSAVFAQEVFRYALVAADLDRLATELAEAIATFRAERATGWLDLAVERLDDRVELVATVDVRRALPEGGDAGDVSGTWRPLDDSSWTPPVRIADHPLLPARLRGARPMREEEGALLVPDVPANMIRSELLEREARPAPADVPSAVWRTLGHLDGRLVPLRPSVRRGVIAGEDEPAWVDAALRGGTWFRIAEWPDQTLGHVGIAPVDVPSTVRIAWVREPGADRPHRAFALHPRLGLLPEPLPQRVAWELSLPDPVKSGMVHVVAVDVDVPAGSDGVVCALQGEARALLLNAALVVNAPAIRDGRSVTVERSIPEPVSLLDKDVVTAEVVDALAVAGLPPRAVDLLRSLPLARFTVPGAEDVVDFEGLAVDAGDGTVTLHAPDDRGRLRKLRRGDEVVFDWYRRTQGREGNVAPGSILLVEQAPSTRPRVTDVVNPLATSWGEDRERDEDAVLRVFGPQTGVPVTPADWERLIRVTLGGDAAGWDVRVWSYAERSLLSTALWPPHDAAPEDAERRALADALVDAGPDTLLVVLGPRDGSLPDGALEPIRRTVDGLVARWAERLPTIRRAVVSRLWPVWLDGEGAGVLPTHALDGLRGALVDRQGRRADVPRATLLLNAVVVGVST